MFINLITPSTRIQNLSKIAKSINIPESNYRWMIVLDKRIAFVIPLFKYKIIITLNKQFVPVINILKAKCEIYKYKNINSVYGHGQRNFAMDKVKQGYIYFIDDDTILHPDFWNVIKTRNEDFIYFQQDFNGQPRFTEKITIGNIDSSSFLVNYDAIKDIRWDITKYESDGLFAKQCFDNVPSKVFLPEILCYYNFLRRS